eukprot:6730587-Prymnesium_polylepis.1
MGSMRRVGVWVGAGGERLGRAGACVVCEGDGASMRSAPYRRRAVSRVALLLRERDCWRIGKSQGCGGDPWLMGRIGQALAIAGALQAAENEISLFLAYLAHSRSPPPGSRILEH